MYMKTIITEQYIELYKIIVILFLYYIPETKTAIKPFKESQMTLEGNHQLKEGQSV